MKRSKESLFWSAETFLSPEVVNFLREVGGVAMLWIMRSPEKGRIRSDLRVKTYTMRYADEIRADS